MTRNRSVRLTATLLAAVFLAIGSVAQPVALAQVPDATSVAPASTLSTDGRTTTSGVRTLTVSQNALEASGASVTVSGRGYDVEKGIYVAFCVVPPLNSPPSPCGGGIDLSGASRSSAWISSNPPTYGEGLATPYGPQGSFSVTLSISPTISAAFDCRLVRCAVVTRNDHVRSSDRSQDVFVPIAFGRGPTPPSVPAIGATPAPTLGVLPTRTQGEDAPLVVVDARVAPQLPVTVASADGSEVTVTDTSRIVSLWGNLTEVVFSLGLGDQVVGRDITATFPEAAHVPLVTRAHDVSAEAVLSQRPTLVLASTNTAPTTALEQIRNVGVPVVVFDEPASVDDIFPRIRGIAAALGVPEAGEALVADTDGRLAEVRAGIRNGPAPRVAFLYMRGPAAVYLMGGPRSGADSMIRAAGGVDAGTALGLGRPFTPLTSEALILAAPDVILMTTTGLESVNGSAGVLEIRGIAQTPAGKNRRIVTVEDGLLYSFGPRTPAALAHLITQLYAAPAP